MEKMINTLQNYTLRALSLIIISCLAITVQAKANDSESLKLELNKISSFEANFKQLNYNKLGKLTNSHSGKIALKPPSRLRWEVLALDPKLIIVDGDKIWNFDPDLEQLLIQKLDLNQISSPLLFFSHDLSRLDNYFTITRIKATKQERVYHCLAKHKEAPFHFIKLSLSNQGFKSLECHDLLQQKTLIQFNKIKYNQIMGLDHFVFVPPNGTDVINQY